MRESEEEMQEMDKFSYLGVMISMGGGMGDEVTHRVLEGRYVWGSVRVGRKPQRVCGGTTR